MPRLLSVRTVAISVLLSGVATSALAFDWKAHEGETVSFLSNNNPWSQAVLSYQDEFTELTGITLKVGGSLVNIGPAGVDIVGPMVKINSGGGGGSAGSALTAKKAAPDKAAKPKKHDPLTDNTYKDRFKDPMPTEGGGTKP